MSHNEGEKAMQTATQCQHSCVGTMSRGFQMDASSWGMCFYDGDIDERNEGKKC